MDKPQTSVKDALTLSLNVGRVLLKNGAEIFRVEQTMSIIFSHFCKESFDVFVMSNGIFVSAGDNGEQEYARIKYVPLSSIHLGRITAVNNLSREIAAGHITLEEADKQLKEIEEIPVKTPPVQIAAAALGSACFGYLVGRSLPDCLAAAAIAAVLQLYLIWVRQYKLGKLVINIFGGVLITALAAAITHFPAWLNVNNVLAGSIIPMIPGVAFVNGIRDIADSDFISGTVRMIDAILAFISIAVGVGTTLSTYYFLTGGAGF